jgi:hypothetical protein
MKRSIVLMAMTVLLTVVALTPASSQTVTPKGPYLLIRDGASGAVTVAWTSTSGVASTLEYGMTQSYGLQAISTPVIINGGGEYRHTCDLSGLPESTRYYYRMTADAIQFEGSFVTPPSATASSLKFFVYSDPQDLESNFPLLNGHNQGASYINSIYQSDPEYQTMLLCAGDVANTQVEYFQSFFNGQETFSANTPVREMLRNLFFATAKGNHDQFAPNGVDHSAYFNSLFPYATGRQYYSFDYGPAHVTVLDNYADLSSGSAQAIWLENDLASSSKPWKFIIVHEAGWGPPMVEGYPNNVYVQTVVQPLAKKYNVAALFSGHFHVYSRAVVPALDGPKTRHIITSTLGPTLRNPTGPGQYIEYAVGNLRNIIKINIINDHTLEYTPVNTYGAAYGTEFDNFTIHRPYNIELAANTGTGATITWMTDVAGGDTVLYGTSLNNVYSIPSYAYGTGGSTFHSVNLTGLTPNTTYWYRVKTNGECSEYRSFVATSVPPATEPTVQASGVTVSNNSSTGLTVSWTPGDGASRLVVIRAGSEVTGMPADQTVYNASAQFGAGSAIGSGNYVVYSGSGSTVTVSGLPSSTECHVAVFEYNGSDYSQNYLTVNPARGSGSTLIGAPVATAATNRSETGFTANWNTVSGADGYYLDVASDDAFTQVLAGYSDLDVGDLASYPVTGLTAGVTYYYRLRAHNSSTSDNSNTVTVLPLSPEPAVQASAITFTGVTTSAMTVNWVKGSGDNSLVILKEGSAVNAVPVDGLSYSASGRFGFGSQPAPGNYVVYNGAGNSVSISDLSPSVTYHVAVFSFNGSASSENYLTGPAVNSRATVTLPPEFRSIASGLWSDGSNWIFSVDGGATWDIPASGPTVDAGEISIINDCVITVASDLIIDNVFLDPGTNLIVSPGATLTLTGSGIYVAGTLTNMGMISGSGTKRFITGSRYVHANPGLIIPSAIWETGSIFEFSGQTEIIPSGIYPNLSLSGYMKTIPAGQSVTVEEDLTTNDLLTISSTPVSSGSLLVTGSSTGNIIYNRTIPDDGATQLWHYMSSPVSLGSITSSKVFYPYDEVAGDWGSPTATIESGRGYTIIGGGLVSYTGTLVTSDFGITATSPYSTAFDGLEYSSRPLEGDRGYGAGGWNLLGNPYPSAMSVEAFIDANYDSDWNFSSFDPNYVALFLYNGSTYQYVTKDDTGWDTEMPNGTLLNSAYIQAGQGFFVLAMNDGALFNFSRSMQAHGTGSVLLKSKKQGDRWPGLSLKVSNGEVDRSTVVVFNQDMTTGLDPMYDVGMMSSGKEIELYTTLVKDNGVNFARQALSPNGIVKEVIPVGLDYSKGGKVTFSADIEALRSYRYWLEDRVTGSMTDLGSGSYSVTLPSGTYGTGRFYLYVTAGRAVRPRPGVQDNLLDVRIWATGERQVVIQGMVSEGSHCEVFGTQGHKLLEVKLQGGDYNMVSMPGSRKGVYLVKVIDQTRTFTQRVVIL